MLFRQFKELLVTLNELPLLLNALATNYDCFRANNVENNYAICEGWFRRVVRIQKDIHTLRATLGSPFRHNGKFLNVYFLNIINTLCRNSYIY